MVASPVANQRWEGRLGAWVLLLKTLTPPVAPKYQKWHKWKGDTKIAVLLENYVFAPPMPSFSNKDSLLHHCVSQMFTVNLCSCYWQPVGCLTTERGKHTLTSLICHWHKLVTFLQLSAWVIVAVWMRYQYNTMGQHLYLHEQNASCRTMLLHGFECPLVLTLLSLCKKVVLYLASRIDKNCKNVV